MDALWINLTTRRAWLDRTADGGCFLHVLTLQFTVASEYRARLSKQGRGRQIPTSRKGREKWGTRGIFQGNHFQLNFWRVHKALAASCAGWRGGVGVGDGVDGGGYRVVAESAGGEESSACHRGNGHKMVDNYFWLRDKPNPEVRAYLEAENDYTDAVMKPTEGFQKKLYDEMLGRIKETDVEVPY